MGSEESICKYQYEEIMFLNLKIPEINNCIRIFPLNYLDKLETFRYSTTSIAYLSNEFNNYSERSI